MLRRLLTVVLLAVFALPGCAAIAKALPYVISSLVEAGNALDSIEAVADVYYDQHPDADRKSFKVAMAKARQAFDGAVKATKGAEHLTQQDVDAAFADFVQAYNSLIELLGPLGIVAPADDGKLTASAAFDDGTPLRVPRGEALVPKVE